MCSTKVHISTLRIASYFLTNIHLCKLMYIPVIFPGSAILTSAALLKIFVSLQNTLCVLLLARLKGVINSQKSKSMTCAYIFVVNNCTESQHMYHVYKYVAVCCMLLCHRPCRKTALLIWMYTILCRCVYLHKVASCLKLIDVTFLFISMFSKQFLLKVISIKVRTLVGK